MRSASFEPRLQQKNQQKQAEQKNQPMSIPPKMLTTTRTGKGTYPTTLSYNAPAQLREGALGDEAAARLGARAEVADRGTRAAAFQRSFFFFFFFSLSHFTSNRIDRSPAARRRSSPLSKGCFARLRLPLRARLERPP